MFKEDLSHTPLHPPQPESVLPCKINDLIKEHCPEGMGWQIKGKEKRPS